MTPYYEDGAVTIYHGDCREILPELEAVDLLATDPPYVGLVGGTKHLLGGVGPHRQVSNTVGDEWSASWDWVPLAWSKVRLGMLVFSGHRGIPELALALPVESRVALLTWYKRNAPVAVNNVPRFDSEHIWAFKKAPGLRWAALKTTVFDIPKPAAGAFATERFIDRTGAAIHPTQKPLELMRTLLAIGGQSVLDPFAGTGTTLVAAKSLNQKAIGIEIEERYCEIAARRCSQEVLGLSA